MTIVLLDQTCAALADRLRAVAPVFVFARTGGLTTPDLTVVELREALRAGGRPGPWILVGASFAGFTALLAAARHPDEVAGLVLVDSSHPQQSEVTLAELPDDVPESSELAAFRKFLRGFGPVWEDSCRMISALGPLGDLPLVVLAAETPPLPASLPAALQQRLVEVWHALQRDHARRSLRGELRIVPGSGHAIAVDAPEAVIAAVTDLVAKVQVRADERRADLA